MNQKKHPTRAIILAAGRGSRLRPFTDTVPKPLLPINGRPLLHTLLLALQVAGVREVAIVTHHLADQIEAFVGNGQQWQMNATFFHQEQMNGTADALKTAVSFLTAPAFLVASDYIMPANYLLRLKNRYQAAGTEMAVSLRELPPEEVSQRSSVQRQPNGHVSRIVEKPTAAEAPSHLGASLLYILPPQIKPYLSEMSLSPRNEYEIQTVLNKMLADGYSMTSLIQPALAEWEPEMAAEAIL